MTQIIRLLIALRPSQKKLIAIIKASVTTELKCLSNLFSSKRFNFIQRNWRSSEGAILLIDMDEIPVLHKIYKCFVQKISPDLNIKSTLSRGEGTWIHA